MSEEGAGQAVIGRAKVGVVENVEEFCSEPQVQSLGEWKLPLKRHVCLRSAESPEYISSEVPLLPSGRCSERRLVEDFAARILRAKKFKWLTQHNIGARMEF